MDMYHLLAKAGAETKAKARVETKDVVQGEAAEEPRTPPPKRVKTAEETDIRGLLRLGGSAHDKNSVINGALDERPYEDFCDDWD